MYEHQAESLIKSQSEKNIILTTGTGSGKTEAMYLPILKNYSKKQKLGILINHKKIIIGFKIKI